MKILFLLTVFLGLAACSPDESSAGNATIYYIPLGSHTYLPVTMERIETAYDRFGTPSVSSRSFVRLLELIDRSGPGKLDGQLIRAKIVLPDGESIFIDNLGGVEMSLREAVKLSDKSYSEVGHLLHRMTKERTSE